MEDARRREVRLLGHHYTVADSPALPKPVQSPHPPIIIGGGGAKRTPALAAAFGSEFNVPFAPPDIAKALIERVGAALADAGRPAESLTCSAAFVVCAGRDDSEIARRAAAIGREVDELRSNSPLVGTPDEIVDKLGAYLQIGRAARPPAAPGHLRPRPRGVLRWPGGPAVRLTRRLRASHGYYQWP